MSGKRKYAKIAITLPEEDLRTADRLAKQQDRPRSWIIAEALRRYAANAPPPRSPGHASTNDPGLGESRRAQLLADLRLSPEERVRAAEETARVSWMLRPPLAKRVLSFERYEDYLEWKRRGES